MQLDESVPQVIGSDTLDKSIALEIAETKIPKQTNASGIQIAKTLNLPNYDVVLEDIIVLPKLVGLARLQGRTTGSQHADVILESGPPTHFGQRTRSLNVSGHPHSQLSSDPNDPARQTNGPGVFKGRSTTLSAINNQNMTSSGP